MMVFPCLLYLVLLYTYVEQWVRNLPQSYATGDAYVWHQQHDGMARPWLASVLTTPGLAFR